VAPICGHLLLFLKDGKKMEIHNDILLERKQLVKQNDEFRDTSNDNEFRKLLLLYRFSGGYNAVTDVQNDRPMTRQQANKEKICPRKQGSKERKKNLYT
jgi:hypothetical protein